MEADNETGCIYVNGRFCRPSEAHISVLDHGLLYGDGLFETLRTYGGVPFRLSEHLRRLGAGLDALGLRGAPPSAQLEQLVRETFRRSGLADAYLRLTLTRGVGKRGLDPSGCDSPTVIIAALPLRTYPEALYREGAQATILWARPAASLPPPTVKSTSYQHVVLARAELSRRRVSEGFFLDESGRIIEGTVSNVFAVSGREVTTPPAECCLPGITRAAVLELLAAHGLSAREGPIERAALLSADEVFITSSLMELLPIVRIDGHVVGGGVPGRTWCILRDSYQRLTGG